MHRSIPIAVVAALLASGVAAATRGSEPPPATKATGSRVLLVPHGSGLQLVSVAGERIDLVPFGTAWRQIAPLVTRSQGRPTQRVVLCNCPAGRLFELRYRSGLSVTIGDGKIVGWFLDGSRPNTITTVGGIRIGTPVAEVRASVAGLKLRSTSLGWRFDAGGLSGTLTGRDGTVTNLWAGLTRMPQ